MKKFLLILFVGFVGIISFCSAGSYTISGNLSKLDRYVLKPVYVKGNSCDLSDVSFHCDFLSSTVSGYDLRMRFEYQMNSNGSLTTATFYPTAGHLSNNWVTVDDSFSYDYPGPGNWIYGCYGIAYMQIETRNSSNGGDNTFLGSWSCTFSGNSVLSLSSCSPQYTSEECQTEYGLVSSGLYNECQGSLETCQSNTSGFNDLLNSCSNNLNACNSSLSNCLQYNCPVVSGGISWSSLFVNGLQHNSAPYISITIPEEISWDYTSTEEEFDLTVSGYNVDTDYIASIIVNQNSKPSQEDLNKLISEVLPLFVPGLAVILLLYFIFRFIKKVF